MARSDPHSVFVLYLCLSVATCAILIAQEKKEESQETLKTVEVLTDTKIIERVNQSLDRALAFLASKQVPLGGWDDNNAVNALGSLAFMGAGHAPGRSAYSDVLKQVKKRLMDAQETNGQIRSIRPSHGPMYEHALCTTALSQMYGMDSDPKLESSLRRAVQLIVSAQASNGGWRYQSTPNDHDLSVTVMQIVALRAASNTEIQIPEATISKAIAYVKSCSTRDGGFGYQPGSGAKPEMAAAGCLSLQLLGRPNDPTVVKSLNYLSKVPVTWDSRGIDYFYYFHYYAMQAQYQAGGKHWNNWHYQIRDVLLEHQNTDGSFACPQNTHESRIGGVAFGKPYWTAMACLILEVYMHYLPAYQR